MILDDSFSVEVDYMSLSNYLTLVVLASTERQTLKKTVNLLLKHCSHTDIAEIVFFLISADCPSAPVAKKIIQTNCSDVSMRICIQKMPGLSPAVHEIPRHVRSSHFLIIGSDLEMSPLTVPDMIKISKQHPEAIVCASKFKKGSKRENYHLPHYLCNRAVNFAMQRLLRIKGTELPITFQIYPTNLFFKMNFTNPKHTFYEFTIRPLTKGVEYIEIPTNYRRRSEGESNFNLHKYIDLGVNFLSAAWRERKRIKKEAKTRKF